MRPCALSMLSDKAHTEPYRRSSRGEEEERRGGEVGEKDEGDDRGEERRRKRYSNMSCGWLITFPLVPVTCIAFSLFRSSTFVGEGQDGSGHWCEVRGVVTSSPTLLRYTVVLLKGTECASWLPPWRPISSNTSSSDCRPFKICRIC